MIGKPPFTISAKDTIQKTWIPEGTAEYNIFKLTTQENAHLVRTIKKHVVLAPGDLVLDVGGRDGDVAFMVQEPGFVDIIDPDPFIKPLQKPANFWRDKAQNVVFAADRKYKLIICCHVMGYLGLQKTQKVVVEKLIGQLEEGGTLILFYNTNQGYMSELLEYSKHIMNGQHDYFDPAILDGYRTPDYQIKHLDVSYTLNYKDFETLGRACWFLFGAMEMDIGSVAQRFLPKLQFDLLEPTFEIGERMTLITKRSSEISFPTLTK